MTLQNEEQDKMIGQHTVEIKILTDRMDKIPALVNSILNEHRDKCPLKLTIDTQTKLKESLNRNLQWIAGILIAIAMLTISLLGLLNIWK